MELTPQELDDIGNCNDIITQENLCIQCGKEANYYLYTRLVMPARADVRAHWIVTYCDGCHKFYIRDKEEKRFTSRLLTEKELFYLKVNGHV